MELQRWSVVILEAHLSAWMAMDAILPHRLALSQKEIEWLSMLIRGRRIGQLA
jgi:hypothetical protein